MSDNDNKIHSLVYCVGYFCLFQLLGGVLWASARAAAVNYTNVTFDIIKALKYQTSLIQSETLI